MSAGFARRAFTVTWCLLTVVALAYLAGLFLWASGPPDMASISVDPLVERPGQIEQRAGVTERITRLEDALETLKHDNAALKTRVKALESARETGAPVAEAPSADPVVTGSIRPTRPAGLPESAITVTYAPLPDDGFAEAPLPGSPLPIAGENAATRTRFAVELAGGLTAAEARKRWAALKQAHAALLEPLEARAASGGGGDALRLLAGPFQNAASAAELCVRLRAAGEGCRETVFTGTPLTGQTAKTAGADQ